MRRTVMRQQVAREVVDFTGAWRTQAVYTGMWDLHLLIVSGGGERTLNGCAGLLARAGVRLE